MQRKFKKGYISLEYVILAAVVGAVAVIMFMVTLPKSSQRPLNVAGNEMVAVLGGTHTNKVGSGGIVGNITTTNASEFTIEEIDANTCAIVQYNGSSSEVVIPSSVSGRQVVAIRPNAFAGKNLENVHLPTTVRTIERRAFYNNKISTINLGYVENIGEEAFAKNSLSLVDTKYIKNIAKGAFSQNKIVTLHLSTSTETIGESAFSNNSITKVSLPTNITQIDKQAFYGNAIGTVYLNANVTTIGEDAFGFQSINSGVVFIEGDYNRFDDEWSEIFDSRLIKEARTEFRYSIITSSTVAITEYTGDKKNVVIPAYIEGRQVVEIKDEVFANKGLTSVTFNEGIQVIGKSAFENNSITSVVLPSTVKSVGEYAFAGNKIKAVHIYGTLTTLGTAAFTSQDIIGGNVVMNDATFNAFNLSNNATWVTYFDSKLQHGK